MSKQAENLRKVAGYQKLETGALEDTVKQLRQVYDSALESRGNKGAPSSDEIEAQKQYLLARTVLFNRTGVKTPDGR